MDCTQCSVVTDCKNGGQCLARARSLSPIASRRGKKLCERLAFLGQYGDHMPVHLTDLTPSQLERLERAAQAELERRKQRLPASTVRKLLREAAAEAGYALDEVFPELSGAARPVSQPMGRPVAPRSPDAVPSVARARHAQTAARVSTPLISPAAPLQAANHLVRALAKEGPRSVALSQSLDAVRKAMGLDNDWPAFHAALEVAARRNWVHFRGNDHCALTDDGFAVASA